MSYREMTSAMQKHPCLPRQTGVFSTLWTIAVEILLFCSVVALGVLLLPVPAVGAHLLDAVLSHPAQLTLGLGGVGVALGDIAGAAGLDDVGELLAAGFLKGMDDIQHAVALAGAQVADEEAAIGLQLADGADMAAGQIHHVDVIADAGAVRGGVIVAEDVHLFQLAHRDFCNVGHQIVGDPVGGPHQ